MEEISDRILVQQVQAGDRGSYETLIDRYYRKVYAICLAIVADPHESQDLCQDVMLRGYEKIGSLRDADRFGGWITEITKNLCFQWLRKRKKNRASLVQLADVSDCTKKSRYEHDLDGAISKLPLELRLPLVMYYMDGCNSRNIAEQLSISHSSVCRRLRKAKSCLYEIVNEV